MFVLLQYSPFSYLHIYPYLWFGFHLKLCLKSILVASKVSQKIGGWRKSGKKWQIKIYFKWYCRVLEDINFQTRRFCKVKMCFNGDSFPGGHLEYFRNISVQYLCVLILSLTELHVPLSVFNCNVFWSLSSSECQQKCFAISIFAQIISVHGYFLGFVLCPTDGTLSGA